MHSDHAFVWCLTLLTWYINIVVGVVVAPAPSSLVAAWPRDPGVAHCPISIIILTIYYHKYSAVHTNPCLYWQRFYCHHQEIQRGLQVFFTALLIALILHPDNVSDTTLGFLAILVASLGLSFHYPAPAAAKHWPRDTGHCWDARQVRGEVSVTRDARRRRGEGRGGVFALLSLDWRLERERTGPREAQSDDGQSQAGQGRSNTGGISWIWQDPWYSVQHKFYQIDLLDSYLVVIFKWTNKILAGWEG